MTAHDSPTTTPLACSWRCRPQHPRRALGGDDPRAARPRIRRLWVDMTRRAPDEVRAPAASMAAFASWLSGDGAKAWCALDEVPTDQNYSMAAVVAGVLHGGLPPSEWEVQRSLVRGLTAARP